jgi:hypothetical protein
MDRAIEYDAQVRRQLDYLAKELDPSEFTKRIPRPIKVVEPPFPDVGCEQYVIGTNGFRHSIAAIYPKLDSLRAGDIALYWDEDRGTVHVGRIQEDGSVVSKWGDGGPVLRHPVAMVPSSYGSWVFFRRIPEEELCNLKGKDISDLIR